jgi:heptosyltransferase-2
MIEVIKHCIEKYNAQIIFYYSPAEKAYAKETHEMMEWNENIFSNVETKSIRELAMLFSNCNFFAGNEGGPRHIAQALDIPSLAIFSPSAEKKEWLSNANDRHQGIETKDIGAKEYFDIKPSHVIEKLDDMIDRYVEKR